MEDPITLRTALNSLQRKTDAIKLSMDQLAIENKGLKEVIMKQELQMKNMIRSNIIKAKIIKSAVDKANRTSNEYLIEIQDLRKELKICLSQ